MIYMDNHVKIVVICIAARIEAVAVSLPVLIFNLRSALLDIQVAAGHIAK